jgi:hypothetical protein
VNNFKIVIIVILRTAQSPYPLCQNTKATKILPYNILYLAQNIHYFQNLNPLQLDIFKAQIRKKKDEPTTQPVFMPNLVGKSTGTHPI